MKESALSHTRRMSRSFKRKRNGRRGSDMLSPNTQRVQRGQKFLGVLTEMKRRQDWRVTDPDQEGLGQQTKN